MTASAAGMSAATSAAATVSTAAAIAGPATAARIPSLVTGRIAAPHTGAPFPAIAPVYVLLIVAIPVIARSVVTRTSPTPPTGASASPASASVVATRHQSCQEQRSKDRHFPTADKSDFHFDKTLSAWRLTKDTKILLFNSEPLGACATSGHLKQTIGAERPSRVPSRGHNQDRSEERRV